MTPQFALLTVAIGAMLLTTLLGFLLVPILRKLNYVQTIKNNGPSWHSSKNGTPTMGGLMLIFGSLISLVFTHTLLVKQIPEMSNGIWQQTGKGLSIAILFALANGAIGFLDDFIKVKKQRNKGLSVRIKLLLQLVVTVLFLFALQQNAMLTTWMQLPGIGLVDLGIAFYPLSYLLILGMVNAVNLTDGVDGLASSVTFLVMLGFLVISALLGWYHMGLYAAALAGGCAGFLCWNFYPAKIFMGDTGSLFLGGAVVAIAYAIGHPELLLILGLVYLIEALSVILQILWFKFSKGKKLFKMTPIHHHFELSGWSEIKITVCFSCAELVCVVIGLIFAYISY